MFGALLLSFVFCWVPGTIFQGFWLHSDTIFLYFFVLIGTSGFSDFFTTIPFENAFLASPRVLNLAHFQHVLWTSFQVRFLLDFVSFVRPFGVPLGTIFEKKSIPKIASKKGDPPLKNPSLSPCPMAPETQPRVRSSRTETVARARILVRIQVEFELLAEFVS